MNYKDFKVEKLIAKIELVEKEMLIYNLNGLINHSYYKTLEKEHSRMMNEFIILK